MMPKILMPIFPRDPISILLRTELFSPVLYAQQFFTALFKQSFSFGIFVPFAVKQCLLYYPYVQHPNLSFAEHQQRYCLYVGYRLFTENRALGAGFGTICAA